MKKNKITSVKVRIRDGIASIVVYIRAKISKKNIL